MPKTTIRDLPRTNSWKLTHCPPRSRWGPGGNTGEINAARKGTGHPTSQCRWPRISVLSNRHSPTYGSYMGLTFTFNMKKSSPAMSNVWLSFVVKHHMTSYCIIFCCVTSYFSYVILFIRHTFSCCIPSHNFSFLFVIFRNAKLPTISPWRMPTLLQPFFLKPFRRVPHPGNF